MNDKTEIIAIGNAGKNIAQAFIKQYGGNNFIYIDTEKQSIDSSFINTKVLFGEPIVKGFGSAGISSIGKDIAINEISKIYEIIKGDTNTVILVAGLGGGTGSGFTPTIAKELKAKGFIVSAVVTCPYSFEGSNRIMQANESLTELTLTCDSISVLKNELFRLVYGNMKMSEAFLVSDLNASEFLKNMINFFNDQSIEKLDAIDRAKRLFKIKEAEDRIRKLKEITLKMKYQEGLELIEKNMAYIHTNVNISRKNDAINLYFNINEYQPNEIAEIITMLSLLYSAIGGDELEIVGMRKLGFVPENNPLEV